MFANIWNHPKTSIAGLLIGLVTVVGVLSQQGITLGHAGTGTVVALIGALATALLGLLSKDPNSTPGSNAAGKLMLFLLVGFAGLTLAGCPSSTSTLDKASKAAADIGAGLESAAQVNHQMLEGGQESPQEAAAVASYIDQAAKVNDAFTKSLQALPAGQSQISNAQIVSEFQSVSAQITTLNQQGILHLKSQTAQTAFATVMVSIQGAIATLQTIIALTTSHRGPPLLPFAPAVPMLGLVLTPAEIEELIALALAAGSALVAKLESLRGESDPQLQSAALAADAAAEQQAEADEQVQTETLPNTTTE